MQAVRPLVPRLSDHEVELLAKKISLVKARPERKSPLDEASLVEDLWYMRPTNLFTHSFDYFAARGDKAPALRLMAKIKVYISQQSAVTFVPTMAEVLSQIPETYVSQVCAFELGGLLGGDEGRHANNYGYHLVEIILYCKP